MNPKPRKPHGNSKLDNLKPESRVLELRDGLLAGWTYDAAMEWLLLECGETTSLDALSRFYQRHCVPVLQERKRWAALAAEGLGKMGAETKAFEEAAMAEAIEFAFQFLRDPNGDPEGKRKWLESLIKKQGQEDARTKLKAALEEKAEAKRRLEAATAKAKSKGGLTPETLAEIEEAAGLL